LGRATLRHRGRFETTVERSRRHRGPGQHRPRTSAFIPPTAPAPSPTPILPAQVIRRGDSSRKVVALSFDAAADTGFAAQILDTLKANGITASFSITGQWAERNPELVRRIAREGHLLMSHSYDHPLTGDHGRPR
jgi:peptidoglycan/xylan/chitin deacetylase (PgdA/CDA1 family)